ncbi:tail fiber assembly protein [Morganella morganii]|uniref:tail fiber assembly protein n=1 Tax=Morganella morganii TaxID=582 RepID=UPI0016470285|nr:tail fiber assembly protein [Morganella morganii]MBC3994328.1 tail fiber assembly protein [Morganella morganii]
MSTLIIDQKFFKDADDNVFCIDIMPMNEDSWESEIKDGWTEISKDEAMSIANPPPTKEQLVAAAESEKQYLMTEAGAKISVLQDAVDFGMATPEEESALKEWKIYRVLLNRVDPSLGADVAWPTPPVPPAR